MKARALFRAMARIPLLTLLSIGMAHAQQTAVGFASPNTRDSMSYADASVSLRSFEERNFIAVADRVVCSLAAQATIEPAIGEVHEPGGGLGLSGAENSIVISAPVTFEQMRYAMALLGRYAHQKYVIVFVAGSSAPGSSTAKLATLRLPPTPHNTVELVLDESGVKYRTLPDSQTVIEFLPPGTSEDPIRKAAAKLHGTLDVRTGSGEILGDDRLSKAMATYEGVIAQFEAAYPAQAFSGKLWTREWHDATSRTCTAAR